MAAYPDRPITVAAPFPAGHVSDLHPRLLAPHVAAALGQPVTVENWPGASGTAALERLRDAAPDGYTVMLHGFGGLAVTPHLVSVAYDPRTDFSAIVKLASAPLVLVVNPALGVDGVDALIALARENPGEIRGGSFGIGSNSHLALTLFNRSTGLGIPHRAYTGGFETTEDLVRSDFDLMFEFPPAVIRHLAAGRLTPVAVTSSRRSTVLPDVPTLAEAGIPGVEIVGWQGLIGPKGMSRQIVGTLSSVFVEAQTIPEVSFALEADGYILESGTPEEFGAFIREEYERWGTLIRTEGIRVTGA
jgi:tripartite-type tricarboxylate transporter receptor subunit TctC